VKLIERRLAEVERRVAPDDHAALERLAGQGDREWKSVGIDLRELSDDQLLRLNDLVERWPADEEVPASTLAEILRR
jgi:hypothetical protein